MANRRMIPTSFFRDPDIMLLGKDAQLILVGLVLAADDYGRELAHAHLLGKEMGFTPKQMEAGLQELVTNDLLLLYVVGKHRYYTLTHWWQWQTITPSRRTPSVHPLPPGMSPCSRVERVECRHDVCALQAAHMHDANMEQVECQQGARVEQTLGMHDSCQENLSKENLSKEKGGEGTSVPPNVIPFPSVHLDSIATSSTTAFSANEVEQASRELASILKTPVNDALRRIVEDYAHDPLLNFFGEADAAREWIEDTKRNPTHKRMSPAWFRSWLKREHEQMVEHQTKRQALPTRHVTGTMGLEGGGQRSASLAQGTPKPPSLMNLEQQYQAAAAGTTGKESIHV